MDINLIISLIIIFGVLSLVFFNCSDSKSKERFDQLDLINDLSGKVEETTGILLLGYQYYYSYISP